MREHAEAKEDSPPGLVPSAPWRVSALEVMPDYKLSVRFMDGTQGVVDMSRFVFDAGAGLFAALRDPAVFSQAYLEFGAINWPGEIDLAPDAMHQEIRKNGHWVL